MDEEKIDQLLAKLERRASNSQDIVLPGSEPLLTTDESFLKEIRKEAALNQIAGTKTLKGQLLWIWGFLRGQGHKDT
ncbi:hypothetical protein NIES4071_82900 [Calothrix sp. NIES-4071]|nr:hypothetical protein NIES4071_82900 [Calothrix sp. NIES-4071]BAZ62559.1 hypothetical protein NIES4105_82830 [Calothrix sp. NIES-4105]